MATAAKRRQLVLRFSVKPVPWPFNRTLRTLRGHRRSDLIRGDAAVAVFVEPQDERARLFDEFLARDLAILVFVKITEICISQGRIGLADKFELGGVEMPVAVAVGRGKQPVDKALPFLAGVDAVVIAVPTRRTVAEHRVSRPRCR